ncbi:alpha/beta hydrolase [Curvibacter sp. APW13]|uniref:alpha/beta hydrolase n=1 Tax=Curvibacter sp. APW13 TaxID=3077236 RepID=UPI0028DED8CB|nr:alpha/beta hydrolase [Curvibacter sp. APW13]MDT8990472.1 alpha/beta hydrolase [Curvibacter sp. APW13]
MPPSGPARYPTDLQPTHADIAYAQLSARQTLDVFLPTGKGPFPVVVNIHGGAFRMGSKEMLDTAVARALLAQGFAVVSVNYRLSAEARFPAAIEDVKAAIRFVRAQAGAWRLDARHVLVFGQSAGGNLASLAGTSAAQGLWDNPALGHADQSSAVQGVIDWFGPSDFAQMDAQAKAQGCAERDQTHGQPDSPESAYLGAPIAQVPDLVRLTNPITHIGPSTPPFLLFKGDQDCVVPVGQSVLLYEALRAAGRDVQLVRLPHAGHGDFGGSGAFSAPENVQRIVAFAQRVVATPTR